MDTVSVVVPTYNRSTLVTGALDSVRNQTHRPIECIVVDDGSTDDTPGVVADWMEEHETDQFSVRLLRQENRGAPAARNQGMEAASGEFLLFLDSDDLLLSHSVELLHQCLIDNEADVSYGDILLVRGGTKKGRKVQRPPSSSDAVNMLNAAPLTSSALIREEAANEVRWREYLNCAQEFAFFLDLALDGADFSYTQSAVLKDRDRAEERITNENQEYSVAIGRVLADVEGKFRGLGASENKAYDRSLIYISNLLCRGGHLNLAEDLFRKANWGRVCGSLFQEWSPHLFLTLSVGPKWSSKIYSALGK
ncbi:glycosyltransferase family 2 protein [Salinibacter sp.]|uniref:glycosyltransferase family 2 protein n=1 Tax=Salinibacter sp. TaxID=2065818 RepID=UPI0021E94B29|nr:glycosyltransferase family 2 protein [Salinibacter sp.]